MLLVFCMCICVFFVCVLLFFCVCLCEAMRVKSTVAAIGMSHSVQAVLRVRTLSTITYGWYRNNQVLPNTTSNLVHFPELGVADAGEGYQCVAQFDGVIVRREWSLTLNSE